MGWEEVDNSTILNFRSLWGGWHPGKSHNDIPGVLNEHTIPIGFVEQQNTVWLEGALQPMFGWTAVNSNLGGAPGFRVSSLFYSPVLGTLIGTANGKIYTTLDTGAPTDVTGSVVVTAGAPVSWTEWQFQTTKYVIGGDGTNQPWKYSGTGNASLLGGTPPTARWWATFQNAVWAARTSTEPSTLRFSNLGDPEVWDTNDNYKFDAPITGMAPLGNLLAVFMDDHIGVVYGTNNRQLTKVDKFVSGVGCPSGGSIVPGKLSGKDVLFFHGNDGIYVFDGTQTAVKISSAISLLYTSPDSDIRLDTTAFDIVTACFWQKYNWYMVGVTKTGDLDNSTLFIVDVARIFETPEGPSAPIWQQVQDTPTAAGSYITLAINPTGALASSCFIGNDAGQVLAFDPSVNTRAGIGFDWLAQTKIFDLDEQSLIQETDIISATTASTASLQVSLNMNLASGVGNTGIESVAPLADPLDVSFIMDSSELGATQFSFDAVDVSNYGRWLQFALSGDSDDGLLSIQGVKMVLTGIGVDPNIGN